MGSSGGGRFRELSLVCLHNNAIVARLGGILVTILHCGTPEPASAPSRLLVLLEPHCEGLLRGGFKVFRNLYISMITQSLAVKFYIVFT